MKTPKEMREEFAFKWKNGEFRGVETYSDSGDVADWWLAKLQEATKEAVEGAYKRAEEIVATEMDNLSVKTTNAEFIACDELAIKIIKRLRSSLPKHE